MATDVYHVNAILSALESVRTDVNPTCGEILLACTEMIRQTFEEMDDPLVRDTLIAGIAMALKLDDTSLLERTWGERTIRTPPSRRSVT